MRHPRSLADAMIATTKEIKVVRTTLQPHITLHQLPQVTEEKMQLKDGTDTVMKTSLAATEEVTAITDSGPTPATYVAPTPLGRGNLASDGVD